MIFRPYNMPVLNGETVTNRRRKVVRYFGFSFTVAERITYIYIYIYLLFVCLFVCVCIYVHVDRYYQNANRVQRGGN